MNLRLADNIYVVFISLYVLAILNGYFFNWLSASLISETTYETGLSGFSEPIKFLLLIIITPFVETYLFQHVPNSVLRKLNVRNNFFLIIIPSVLFGCVHFYFWTYVLMAFVGGVLINVLYVYAKGKSIYYFLIVTTFHSLYNLYGYVFVL